MKPATILFLAANPAGTSQLSLDNESRSIGQKIRASTSLMLEGIPEENTPTLLVRAGVDPATLFVVERPARGADESDAGERAEPAAPAKPKRKAPDLPPRERETQAEPATPAPMPPVATQPQPLNLILPGLWQVQIQLGFGAAQMQIELFPTGQFRGQLAAPMGQSIVEGQWQANPYTQQIGLSGQQTNGFQVAPYGVVVQVASYDAQRIVGMTNVDEQVSWQKLR